MGLFRRQNRIYLPRIDGHSLMYTRLLIGETLTLREASARRDAHVTACGYTRLLQRGAEVATKRAVRVILLCQEGMRASAAGLRSGKTRRRKKPLLGGLLEIPESFQNLETDQCLPVPIHPDG